MRALAACLCLIPVLHAGASDDSQAMGEIEINPDVSVQRIVGNVWIHTSRRELANGYRFPAHGLIVKVDEQLLLIDTAWGNEHTAALVDWIRSELRLPIAAAFATHFHDDSLGGIEHLRKLGIETYSSALTRRLAEQAGLAVLPVAVPGLNRAGDAIEWRGVELFYPGPAHSEDTVFAWIPESRILFGSCAVRSPAFRGLGNTGDASIEGWPLAIALARERYREAEVVVPGHGPHGDSKLLDYTLTLFTEDGSGP